MQAEAAARTQAEGEAARRRAEAEAAARKSAEEEAARLAAEEATRLAAEQAARLVAEQAAADAAAARALAQAQLSQPEELVSLLIQGNAEKRVADMYQTSNASASNGFCASQIDGTAECRCS